MAMTLFQAIHQYWSEAAALSALLPAARVTTGPSADPSLPRAVVYPKSDRLVTQANDGTSVRAVAVQILVFDRDFDDAVNIVEEVKNAFNGATFDLDYGDSVIDTVQSDGSAKQQTDGVWQWTLEFKFTVQHG
jgi:hypothetical protein